MVNPTELKMDNTNRFIHTNSLIHHHQSHWTINEETFSIRRQTFQQHPFAVGINHDDDNLAGLSRNPAAPLVQRKPAQYNHHPLVNDTDQKLHYEGEGDEMMDVYSQMDDGASGVHRLLHNPHVRSSIRHDVPCDVRRRPTHAVRSTEMSRSSLTSSPPSHPLIDRSTLHSQGGYEHNTSGLAPFLPRSRLRLHVNDFLTSARSLDVSSTAVAATATLSTGRHDSELAQPFFVRAPVQYSSIPSIVYPLIDPMYQLTKLAPFGPTKTDGVLKLIDKKFGTKDDEVPNSTRYWSTMPDNLRTTPVHFVPVYNQKFLDERNLQFTNRCEISNVSDRKEFYHQELEKNHTHVLNCRAIPSRLLPKPVLSPLRRLVEMSNHTECESESRLTFSSRDITSICLSKRRRNETDSDERPSLVSITSSQSSSDANHPATSSPSDDSQCIQPEVAPAKKSGPDTPTLFKPYLDIVTKNVDYSKAFDTSGSKMWTSLQSNSLCDQQCGDQRQSEVQNCSTKSTVADQQEAMKPQPSNASKEDYHSHPFKTSSSCTQLGGIRTFGGSRGQLAKNLPLLVYPRSRRYLSGNVLNFMVHQRTKRLGTEGDGTRSHSQSKRYPCDICGRAFTRSNTLVTHRVCNCLKYCIQSTHYNIFY